MFMFAPAVELSDRPGAGTVDNTTFAAEAAAVALVVAAAVAVAVAAAVAVAVAAAAAVAVAASACASVGCSSGQSRNNRHH